MSENILRGAIQKVATGPEFSKNISEEDSYHSMLDILGSDVDSVQAYLPDCFENEKRDNG